MSERETLVTVDDEHVYPAWVDDRIRWNGWLCPEFDLDTVYRIAADTAADPLAAETVAVVERRPCEWTGDRPSVVVVIVAWNQVLDNPSAKSGVERVPLNQAGRYNVGTLAWTWHETEPPKTGSPETEPPRMEPPEV